MPNLTNLKKNDVIENGQNKHEVLEIVGCIYFLSAADEFDVAEGFYTLAELERAGYRIVESARGAWNPEHGSTYFIPAPDATFNYVEYLWIGSAEDDRRLSLKLVCRTKEEAIALAEKMLKAVK
jgi:hypothetical protein